MVAANVRTLSKGFDDNSAAFPVAISAIIVSPKTRPTPKSKAAKIPGVAAGKITKKAVCHLLAPSAKLASEKVFGTAESASSEMV